MITYTVRTAGPIFSGSLAQRFDAEIQGELAQLGALGQRLVVQGTPRGIAAGGGGLAGSISMAMRGTPAARESVVSSSLFYAPIVEVGRRPGRRPPVEAILLWTRRKLSVPARDARRVAFLIARKIGRSGFRGSHMFQRAAERISPIASTRWAALGERLARLGNGTA